MAGGDAGQAGPGAWPGREPDDQLVRRHGRQPVPLDPVRQVVSRPDDSRRVDPVRAIAGIPADRARAAAQQGRRSGGISALRVREAHRHLGQALPQIALGGLRRLPRCLQHFMRAERPAMIDQLLSEGERAGRRQRARIRHRGLAGSTAAQRPAQLVPRPRVARPA